MRWRWVLCGFLAACPTPPPDDVDAGSDGGPPDASVTRPDASVVVDPRCTDALLNGLETDVDCGGGVCAVCPVGRRCTDGVRDCATQSCAAGQCVEPTCSDQLLNGVETDVDCGASCPACASGRRCQGGNDCQSGVCSDGGCAEPRCGDGVKNGLETSMDCGGSCRACADGQGCAIPADCFNLNCVAGTCVNPGACTPSGFCWQSPTPSGNGFLAISSGSSAPPTAVGEQGLVAEFNGSTWVSTPVQTESALRGVYRIGPSEGWAVGDRGTMLRLSSAGWQVFDSGVSVDLFAIHGTGGSDIWAVGDAGTILHFDGVQWSRVSSGTTQPLFGVSASSPTDVWALGVSDGGRRFNGTAWTHAAGAPGAVSVSAHSPTHAVAALGNGFFARWDGSSWLRQSYGTGDRMLGTATAPDSGNQYFGGDRLLITLDLSTGFRLNRSPIPFNAVGIHSDGVRIAGDGVARLEALGRLPYDFRNDELLSAWFASELDGWVVGRNGVIARWTGADHVPWQSPTSADILNVFGRRAGPVLALTQDGKLLRFTDPDWAVDNSFGSDPFPYYGGWAAEDAGTMVVVGFNGNIQMFTDGGWGRVPSPTMNRLQAVWGDSPSDIWAVGLGGVIVHFDGVDWSLVQSPTLQTLFSVFGDRSNLWAVGNGGTIVGKDRTRDAGWRNLTSPTQKTLFGGSSSLKALLPPQEFLREAWAVGEDNTVLQYNGRWRVVQTGGPETLYGAASGGVSSATEIVHAVGTKGTVRGNESAFSVEAGGQSRAYRCGIAFQGVVWVAGDQVAALWDGLRWSEQPLPSLNVFTMAPNSLWGLATRPDGGTAVVNAGTSALRRKWFVHTELGARCRGIVQTGIDTGAIACDGDGGVLLQGKLGQQTSTRLGVDPFAIWRSAATGQFWIAGSGGKVLRGAALTSETTGTTETIRALWGPTEAELLAVGDRGTVLRRQMTGTWTSVPFPSTVNLVAVGGQSATNFFVSGDDGTLMHYDGTTWTDARKGIVRKISGFLADDGGTWAVGERGTILFKAR